MKPLTRAALGLALLLGRAASQTAPANPPSNEDLVLRFDVDLVQIDAVVTDQKGNHVAGLSADDFEVRQDGQPQRIKHLTYVSPQRVSTAEPGPGGNGGSGQLRRDQVRRTIVLLLDDMRMEFADFVYAQRALTRFIDHGLQPGDLAAVVRTSGGSGVAQQLSADPEFLRAVLRRTVWRPPPPAYFDDALQPVLTQVVWGLREFPGRKSVILISPSSPGHWDWDVIQRITDFASRSSVTIQTIDARGLAPVGLPDASDRGPRTSADAARFGGGVALPLSVMQANQYVTSQVVLRELADMTAGLFQHDNNGIFEQVSKAADDAEGYYLIGWYPGSGAFAGDPHQPPAYHNLQVTVKRRGLTVRTRHGYYAAAGTNPASVERFSPQAQMQEALFSPFLSGDIGVRLTPSFGYDPKLGAYVKSLLHIQPAGIEFHPQGNACDIVRLEVLASALPLNWSAAQNADVHWRRDELQVCGAARDRALRDGLVAVIRTPIERPGSVQMRAAVRNMAPDGQEAPAVAASLVRRGDLTPVHIPIGSAAAVVEIPDVPKAGFALGGVSLRSPGAPSIGVDIIARLTAEGDPATRQFHPGAPLTYEFELFGRDASVETRFQVTHEGKAVYTSEPLDVKPGSLFSGNYRLDAAAEPGKYLFGVVAKPARGQGHTVAQWIDFEVVP